MKHTRYDEIVRILAVPQGPSEGRGRLVWAAIHLFYRHGINAVGVDKVIANAGVSKTTFYKHFECKDDLVVAAIEERDVWEMQAWGEAARIVGGDDPRQQLIGLVDVLDILFDQSSFQGCQFINAASEFPNPNDPIHQAAAAHKRANRAWIFDLAKQAGSPDAGRFADTYTMLFEGALVLRQVHDRDDAAKAARPAFEQLVEEFIPD